MGRQKDLATISLASSLILGSCGPIELRSKGQIDATSSSVAELTATPTITPEATNTPTNTPTPTDTPTPEPTPTPTPAMPDILTSLEQQGILFPEDTTSRLEREHYEFTVKFSEGVLSRPGLDYVKLPERIMDRWFLQISGQMGYLQRNVYPEYYSDYFELEQEIEEKGQADFLRGDPVFMNTSRRLLNESGTMPFKANNSDVSGEIDSISLNLVSSTEFEEVLDTLEVENVVYGREVEWLYEFWPEAELGLAYCVEEEELHAYFWMIGLWDGFNSDYFGEHMPEVAPPGKSRVSYYNNINSLIHWAGSHLLNVSETQPYDPAIEMLTSFTSFICADEEESPRSGVCQDEANETLSPLYARLCQINCVLLSSSLLLV